MIEMVEQLGERDLRQWRAICSLFEEEPEFSLEAVREAWEELANHPKVLADFCHRFSIHVNPRSETLLEDIEGKALEILHRSQRLCPIPTGIGHSLFLPPPLQLIALSAEVNAPQGRRGKLPLHTVITSGEGARKFELMLQLRADPNAVDARGNTPLHLLVRLERSGQWIKRLIEAGADVNLPNKKGESPLLLAVKGHRSEAVEALLEKGACVDMELEKGGTLLHLVAKRIDRKRFCEDQAIVQHLVDHGVDANAQDENGNTALHFAGLAHGYGRRRVWDCLKRNGASTQIKNNRGDRPYYPFHAKTSVGDFILVLPALVWGGTKILDGLHVGRWWRR